MSQLTHFRNYRLYSNLIPAAAFLDPLLGTLLLRFPSTLKSKSLLIAHFHSSGSELFKLALVTVGKSLALCFGLDALALLPFGPPTLFSYTWPVVSVESTRTLTSSPSSEIKQRYLRARAIVFDAIIKPFENMFLDPAMHFTNVYTALVHCI
jgi:hypothetical protein